MVTGCGAAAARPAARAEVLDPCPSVRIGACQLSGGESSDRVVSRCEKQEDGSLVCDASDAPPGGPDVSSHTLAE